MDNPWPYIHKKNEAKKANEKVNKLFNENKRLRIEIKRLKLKINRLLDERKELKTKLKLSIWKGSNQ